MSFLDYLHDHRDLYIDHRLTQPRRALPSATDAELDEFEHADPGVVSGGGAGPQRRRRARPTPRDIRYRHVRPAFGRSPFTDPLPYEEPWERAFR